MHQSVEYAQYKAQQIKELMPEFNRSGIKILDFGCGDGLMTYYLREVFFEATVIGVDKKAEKIEQAQNQYPDINFNSIKDKKLEYPDIFFDLVIVADVLHHIPKAQHAAWLLEFMRVVKPGGFCIVLEINPWNISSRFSFKKNLEEKNAQMLSPWYAWHLLKFFGKAKLFSFSLPWPFYYWEWFLCKIPFGAFYAVTIQKKMK
jgi:ubiquinone/menaquinone biosynthesis C-methylase UbiE